MKVLRVIWDDYPGVPLAFLTCDDETTEAGCLGLESVAPEITVPFLSTRGAFEFVVLVDSPVFVGRLGGWSHN